MIPGARTAEGQLRIVAGPPAATDPRMGGFALTPIGEIYCVGTQSAFSPADLFLNGEQGAWYDPSDLSTMFQDSAGTTPVTADGQPVGLILDKSKGLALGPELVTNGTFAADTSWTKTDATIVGGKLVCNTSTAWVDLARQTLATPIQPGTYKVSASVSNYISGSVSIGVTVGASFSLSASNNGLLVGYLTLSATAYDARIQAEASGFIGDIDDFSIKLIAGNHASQATAAARPLYKTDGTYHWLQFDGVDDSLSTGNIDFTSTDKMSVFGGVKAVTTTDQTLVSLSVNGQLIAPTFMVLAPNGGRKAKLTLNLTSYGLVYPTSAGSLASANSTYTLIGLWDTALPTNQAKARIVLNGVEETVTAEGAADSGTGPFGNLPLHFGARSASEFFNGNIYSLIIRGALSTPQEITDTETWVNGKTGAY